MTSVQETAEGAARLIQENGWVKRRYIGDDGELCLSSAVTRAALGDRESAIAAGDALLDLIRRRFPERMCTEGTCTRPGHYSITSFNDHPLTVREDAEFLLKLLADHPG